MSQLQSDEWEVSLSLDGRILKGHIFLIITFVLSQILGNTEHFEG